MLSCRLWFRYALWLLTQRLPIALLRIFDTVSLTAYVGVGDCCFTSVLCIICSTYVIEITARPAADPFPQRIKKTMTRVPLTPLKRHFAIDVLARRDSNNGRPL